MVAMSHDRTWALAGEAPTPKAAFTRFSSPVTSPDRMNDQEAERRRPAALGFHTRRTMGAPPPPLRQGAMERPSGVNNLTPSMP